MGRPSVIGITEQFVWWTYVVVVGGRVMSGCKGRCLDGLGAVPVVPLVLAWDDVTVTCFVRLLVDCWCGWCLVQVSSLLDRDVVYITGRDKSEKSKNGKSANLNNTMQLIYPDIKDPVNPDEFMKIPINELMCLFDADQTCSKVWQPAHLVPALFPTASLPASQCSAFSKDHAGAIARGHRAVLGCAVAWCRGEGRCCAGLLHDADEVHRQR